MTDINERMAVNAAIEKLINLNDPDGEAAQIVINFGHKLPVSQKVTVEVHTQTTAALLDLHENKATL